MKKIIFYLFFISLILNLSSSTCGCDFNNGWGAMYNKVDCSVYRTTAYVDFFINKLRIELDKYKN